MEPATCGNKKRPMDTLAYVIVGDTDESVVFCQL
jgi:hypothetical protein